MERPHSKNTGGQYFKPNSTLEFIPSGCTLLDCVLGGGYPLGRVVNIVGDKSVGKTLLAIEACANFANKYPDGQIIYAESEAAFDIGYAQSLGLPVDRVIFAGEEEEDALLTVEDFYEDLEKRLAVKKEPMLYVLDSLDALSDRAELVRKIDEGTYGATKAKQLSQIFRRITQKLKHRRVCLIVISQVRENIGVSFGEKYTRSGGKALDFYASQAIWLSHLGKEERTVKKQARPYAIRVRAKCKKNKVGEPLRSCDFMLRFGFGVDDVQSSLEWLQEIGELRTVVEGVEIETDKGLKNYLKEIEKLSDEEYRKLHLLLKSVVTQQWEELEDKMKYGRKKYAS